MGGQNETNNWLLPLHVKRKGSFGQKLKITYKAVIVSLLGSGRFNIEVWGSGSIIPRINWERLRFTSRKIK